MACERGGWSERKEGRSKGAREQGSNESGELREDTEGGRRVSCGIRLVAACAVSGLVLAISRAKGDSTAERSSPVLQPSV
eukprot:2732874-Rhodomonas_salina.2